MPVATITVDKTQEEISKNIKEVTKLIQAHSGNPAQIKAKKDEEAKLVKEQKKVISQWNEVLDEEQKALEQNKVRVTTMTSFIGLEAKRYFAETDRQMVTWGGLAKSLGTGVKNWFEAASKQNTMLGRTLRLGASLWKGVNDHIIGTVRNVFGKLGSEIREVLGELAEVFDFIKGIFMGLFNFVKDAFLGFFKRVPPADKKRNKLLQKIVDFMRRDEKRDLLNMGQTTAKGGLGGLVLMLAMIAAALLGGMIKRFITPFLMVSKVLKIGVAMQKLKDFLLSFQAFAKPIFTIKWTFIKWGRKIAEIFGAGGKFAKFGARIVKMVAPFLKIAKAFAWGFRFLGWPLTIILGIIDFIRGVWGSDAETWGGKIIDGLKMAVKGFLDLPVKLLGWIIEKTLGLFGVEVDGVAGKIMDAIMWIVEAGFGWVKPIVGFIEGFIEGGPIGAIKGFFKGLEDIFMHLISIFPEPVQQMIIGFFKNIGEFFSILVDKFKGLLSWFGIDFGETQVQSKVGTVGQGDFMQMTDAEAKKLEAQQKANSQAVVEAVEKQTEDTNKKNEELAKKQGDNIAVAMSQSGGYNAQPSKSSDEQISDEVDFGLAVWGNINSSMG